MQVDDRVSLKTWHFREAALSYDSQIVRFGASDAVSLIAIHYNTEGVNITTQSFSGMALSRNPEHEEAPPAEIAAYWWDEALYGRAAWQSAFLGGSTSHGFWGPSTIIVPMYGIVVPTRQIAIHINIGAGSYGHHAECYFRQVKLSREETNLLNLTWGKYRR